MPEDRRKPHNGRMNRSRLGLGKGRCRARCQGNEQSTPAAQEWEARYLHGRTSWDIGAAQPEFLQLAQAGAFRGRVLDVGCGTGEHALLAARMGLAATGIDVSRTALAIAADKATDRELTARFVECDALELARLGEQFDTVLDSGLFHWLGERDKYRYVNALKDAVPPGGRCFILCFSGRRRWLRSRGRGVTASQIRAAFSQGWIIDAIDVTRGTCAWLVHLTRT